MRISSMRKTLIFLACLLPWVAGATNMQFVFAQGKEPKTKIDYKKRKSDLLHFQKELLMKQLINVKDQRIAALEELLRLAGEKV